MTFRMGPNSRFLPPTAVLIGAVSFAGILSACQRTQPGAREVTAYVSADRPFSEPILKDYERWSGVRVNVVFDTEETKSTGLANRLIAEQAYCQVCANELIKYVGALLSR